MSRGKTDAGALPPVQQIGIEEVAAAVTQGVLRAIAAQRGALSIGGGPTTGGAALEFIVQFGAGGAGGGLASLGSLGTPQLEASGGKAKK